MFLRNENGVTTIRLCVGDGGVETAEEAVEPAEPDINELCTDMFDKMAVFLQGELTGLNICLSPFVVYTGLDSHILYTVLSSG